MAGANINVNTTGYANPNSLGGVLFGAKIELSQGVWTDQSRLYISSKQKRFNNTVEKISHRVTDTAIQ